MSNKTLRYISSYSPDLQHQVSELLDENQLGNLLKQRHPQVHTLASGSALYSYAQDIKNQFLRSSPPISKVIYDDKIHVVDHALGLHTFVSRVQGGKLKAKKEIRISSLFRNTPESFLRMIVVHELAHLREKEHNKAFYKLCQHMEPDYHQLELDVRLYLCHREQYGDLW
ncbi:MAG: M48 family metallopeptidase [Pseudomonadales bacterium]|nr:M48 family metallopeptidase [Pseudomonadales bacterium]